jgi:hypothetical protein
MYRTSPLRYPERGRGTATKTPLSARRPDLAREWHPTKNGRLTLDQCAANSPQSVWWQCHQNPHHVWRASVKSRYSKRTGCRRCTLARRAYQDESFHARTLSRKSPELAATWHPTKNGTLTLIEQGQIEALTQRAVETFRQKGHRLEHALDDTRLTFLLFLEVRSGPPIPLSLPAARTHTQH